MRHLRGAAIDAGAIDISASCRIGRRWTCRARWGRVLEADFVIGADGATSTTARTAGLVDPGRVLWGFAVRGYCRPTSPCR